MKVTIPAILIVIIAVVNLTLPTAAVGPTGRMTVVSANFILLLVGLYFVYLGLVHTRRLMGESEGRERKIRELEAGLSAAEKRAGELSFEKEAAVKRLETERVASEKQAKLAEASERESLVHAGILHFLSLLQTKGRFVDFVMDDIAPYDDKQVGAAGRVVHQGCRAVIQEYFDIVPVREQGEGTAITVDREDNPSRYRLVGKVVGQPPFRGTLLHRGWRTKKIALPKVMASAPSAQDIISPAEIELT